jgi:outer membrane protein OmpA-like peptidoglycan-associated protein
MSFNLLDAVKGYFTPDLVGQASSFFGETDTLVSKGLDAVIPSTLAGLVRKAELGDTSTLMNLAKTAYDRGILNQLQGSFKTGGEGVPSIGPGILTSLFGDKYGALANAVSSFTGMKGANVSSLFGTVAPLALGLLGKYAKDSNAAPGAIASLLGSQKETIMSAVPAGLNLSGILRSEQKPTPTVVVQEKKRPLWPIVVSALGALALLILIARGCGADHEAAPVHDTTVVTKTNIVVIKKEPLKVTLPNGVVIDAYNGSIEDLLVAFLKDPEAKPGNDNWFDFNDLNFKFGTAEIIPESRKEVDNIAQILKAFPNARIKIGGYTDKVGDASANLKISKERASAVTEALKNLGVGSQLEVAEGYGSEFAKYPPSAPEEDRIKDRRVSVSVRAK